MQSSKNVTEEKDARNKEEDRRVGKEENRAISDIIKNLELIGAKKAPNENIRLAMVRRLDIIA
jgi:hypothetical protein